jgi:hypothetical protein
MLLVRMRQSAPPVLGKIKALPTFCALQAVDRGGFSPAALAARRDRKAGKTV